MKYELAISDKDIEACQECVASTGYYHPVVFGDLGGFVLMAKDHNGIVAGVVWATRSGKIAFLDYLAIRDGYSGLGVRLLVKLRQLLQGAGVRQVRYAIHGDNIAATRISDVFNGAMDFPYIIGCAPIGGP